MRLHTLTLENYRRFRKVEVEFPDGVTAVVGRNGAGKSTVVEAIGWALFGHDAARTDKEYLKRRAAPVTDDVKVQLAFEHAGHRYEVARFLSGAKGTHHATLTVDGTPVVAPGAHSQREVTEYLERALHMDATTFFASLVARQADVAGLAALGPAERKASVLRMLRVDVVDEAVRLARQAKRDAVKEASYLVDGAEPKDLEAKAEAARATAETAKQVRATALAEALTLEATAAERRAGLDALNAKAAEHAALAERVASARGMLEGARREVQQRETDLARVAETERALAALGPAPDLAALRAEVTALQLARQAAEARALAEREVAEGNARVARLAAELPALDALAAKANALAARRMELLSGAEASRQQLAEAQSAGAKANGEIPAVKAALEDVRKRAGDLRALGRQAPCPTCERPLDDCHDGLLARLEAEVQRLEASARTLEQARSKHRRAALEVQERLEKIGAETTALEAEARETLKAEARRAELVQRLAAERDRVQEAQGRLAALPTAPWNADLEAAARKRLQAAEAQEAQRARLGAEAARRPAAEEAAAKARATVATLVEALAGAEQDLLALAFDAGSVVAAQRAVQAAQAALGERRVAAERALAEAARAEADVARWTEERAKAEARLAKRSALLQEAALLERLAGDRDTGLLCDFKLHLTGRIRPLLAAEASSLYGEATEGKYGELHLDDDYALKVVDDGEAFPLARMSGGEADLAALCLRLAVGRVLAERAGGGELGFLVLDEVFGSQDDQRRASILRLLAALAGRFRQILLVTHIDGVKDAVDHVLRVEETANGEAVVTSDA